MSQFELYAQPKNARPKFERTLQDQPRIGAPPLWGHVHPVLSATESQIDKSVQLNQNL